MVPLSPRYLAELKLLQAEFLAEITESEEETIYRDKCYADWVKSTFKPRVNAASHKEQ